MEIERIEMGGTQKKGLLPEKLDYCTPKLSRFGRFDELTLGIARADGNDGQFGCKIEGGGSVGCIS